jgi:hypothetical protein
MTKKRTPVAERRQETGTDDRPLRRSSRITGRIGADAPTSKGADVVRWACGVTMTDDNRTDGDVGRHGTAVVNGPEGEGLDWLSVDWAKVEADVGRLRQRIFTAACLSRMRSKSHVRFLGGPGTAMSRGYPTPRTVVKKRRSFDKEHEYQERRYAAPIRLLPPDWS